MSALVAVIEDLVAANHILSFENVVDAFGHVSARHPSKPDRFLLSRACFPKRVTPDDIMEFTLDGEPVDPRGRQVYLERFIHSGLYKANSGIQSVVHSHSLATIPFGAGGEKIRPMMHNCAPIGEEVPIWDSRDKFGDTDLMVTNMEMGLDLAHVVGANPTALMRGHGAVGVGRSIQRAVYVSVKLQEAAMLQRDAARYKEVKYLSVGEIRKHMQSLEEIDNKPSQGLNRAWQYWCERAGIVLRILRKLHTIFGEATPTGRTTSEEFDVVTACDQAKGARLSRMW